MKTTIAIVFFAMVLASFNKESTTTKSALSTKPVLTSNHLFAGKTLNFSGYTWTITDRGTGTEGPGPNHWSSSNAFVDPNGYLHLKITKNTTTNTWQCAQVVLNQRLGYGKYQWEVEGRIDTLDRNVVLGLFNYSGNERFDEMDIEYSRWGRAGNKNVDFTLYPATGSTQPSVETTALVNLSGRYTTHRITRTSTSAEFESLEGFHDDDENVYASKTWTSPPQSISTLAMPVFMNLWLLKGVAPANGQDVEIIIHNFKFTAM